MNHPIEFKYVIDATNRTDMLDYYPEVSFTHGHLPGDTSGQDGAWVMHERPDGKFEADGTVVFNFAGGIWEYIHPHDVHIRYDSVEVGDPLFIVSDVSDTLSIATNDSTLFLTWILVGFSVLMLQPILEAILLQEETPPTGSGKLPPQQK